MSPRFGIAGILDIEEGSKKHRLYLRQGANYEQYMLRSLITDLTPPIIWRFAQTLRRQARGLGTHTFEGCYKSLADVPCGEGRYNDDALAADIVSSLERLRTPDARPTLDDRGRFILPLLVGHFCHQTMMVLDFGGGPCTGLRLIADHVPDLDLSRLSYQLVETPALCRAIKSRINPILSERFRTASFVEISKSIPAAAQGSIIVNASSAVQYISDWRSTVAQLTALRPDYFIVGLTRVFRSPDLRPPAIKHSASAHRNLGLQSQ